MTVIQIYLLIKIALVFKTMSDYLLKVENLKMHFPIHGGIFWRQIGKIFAVDGVSFAVKQGETVGLVGESGCGKTTVGRSILKLYTPTHGKVYFEGKDILKLKRKDMQPLRRDMQMIFQDPFESLDARLTIGDIIEEPFLIHGIGNSEQRKENVKKLLNRVGISQNAINNFPHEFSGGQRQRIGIARAIALNPKLIICDEPVSALDVSIQSQILNLLLELQEEMKLTMMFIAHDLAVVKHISDRIAVMYLGKIVEYTNANALYDQPLHPYTQALISAIPIPDPTVKKKKQILHGEVPSPKNPPPGCSFHTRCPIVIDRCKTEEPLLRNMENTSGNDHLVACHRPGEQ